MRITVTAEERERKSRALHPALYRKDRRENDTVTALTDIYGILTTTANARKAHRGELAVLTEDLAKMQALNASPYDKEKVEKQIADAKARRKELELKNHAAFVDAVEKAKEASKASHKSFLKRNELPAVLTAIAAVGKKMDLATFDTLVSPFLLDQTSLRIILAALKTNEITTGQAQIQKLLYDDDTEWGRIEQMDFSNLNGVSTAVSRLVAKDGIQTDEVISDDEVINAARKAAGLKSEAERQLELAKMAEEDVVNKSAL